jgi:effector-binding domain-containing protein
MDPTVSIVTLAPQPIAVVRRRMALVEVPRQIIGLFDVVYREVRRGAIVPSGHNVALYRPAAGDEFEVECGVQVASRFADLGEVVCSETPGGEAATAIHMGAYDRLPHGQVMDWVRRNGRRLTGVSWEVYGDWSDDPAQRRTDVFHLLEPG